MMENQYKFASAWYNYRTDEYDYLYGIPENFSDYIPQDPSAQALYDIHVNHEGLESVEAAIKVLSLLV